jgi:CheY-like chemotaxis protein
MNLVAEAETKNKTTNVNTNDNLQKKLLVYLSQISDLLEQNQYLIAQITKTKMEVADLLNQNPEEASSTNRGKDAMSEKPLDGIKVLVAEDSPDNQMLMRQYLKLAGAEVDIVENGQQVIEKALEDRHHLILMDVMMPVCDGYEATRTLREKGYTKPIIALTAHALKEQREQSFKEGCNEHLVKPINRPLLISTIARFAGAEM